MPNLTGVRERRQRTGVKSGEFAAMIGYSRTALISIENGTRPASPEGAHRIASALTELGVKTEAQELFLPASTVPDNPPKQPSGPKGPTRRQEKEQDHKGPKRVQGTAA